jgi:hypothetical protein
LDGGSSGAANDTFREVRKLKQATRVVMQSHAVAADLDEINGTVTAVDEERFRSVRGDITDSRSHSQTNIRFVAQMTGLSAGENVIDYKKNDLYNIASRNNSTGESSAIHKSMQTKFASDYVGVEDEDQRIAITTSHLMEDSFAPQMRSGMPDFIMTMAKSAGIEPGEAVRSGKMAISLVNIDGKRVPIRNVRELISMYNNGDFSPGHKRPSKQIPRFSPLEVIDGGNKGGGGGGGGGKKGGGTQEPPTPELQDDDDMDDAA